MALSRREMFLMEMAFEAGMRKARYLGGAPEIEPLVSRWLSEKGALGARPLRDILDDAAGPRDDATP